jgi:hypothetical protein
LAVRYRVDLKDTTGTKIAVFDNFIRLIYTRQINKAGFYSFWLNGEDSRVDLFNTDYLVEVWRSDKAKGVDWYLDFEGFHRTPVYQRRKDGTPLFTSYGRGYTDLIARRHIFYNPDTVYTSKSGVGETVIKEFVDENAGPSATSPPRLQISGVTSGLTIEADAAGGSNWEGQRTDKNLLTVIQQVSDETGIYFAVVGTGSGTFEFQTYVGQPGDDRSIVGLVTATGLNGAGNAPVIFSVLKGNMSIPIFSISRSDEINTLLMLGAGRGAARLKQLVQNGDQSDSPWNQKEGTRQSTRDTTAAALTDKGNSNLLRLGKQENFTFDIIQSDSTVYGRDYFFGDKVTGRFDMGSVSVERNVLIQEIEVSVSAENQIIESLRVELSDTTRT